MFTNPGFRKQNILSRGNVMVRGNVTDRECYGYGDVIGRECFG